MVTPALFVAVAVAAFGSPQLLRPHQAALSLAEGRAMQGDFTGARALLELERGRAEPEAADLLTLHERMLARLQAFENSASGFGRHYVPYVFAPWTARLPAAVDDFAALTHADDAAAALLSSPAVVVVEHERRAVALLVRGALLDAARRHGLPLQAVRGDGVVRIVIEQEDVDRRETVLEGTGMHSYTTYLVIEHERVGHRPLDNGVIVQLLGINEARAIDTNLDRVVDRALTGLVVEWIRRSLLSELHA
jgi:hypothetical protein